MEICKFPRKYHKEDYINFFGFEKFKELAGDFMFIDGRVNFNGLDAEEYKNKKIVYYELEEPNRFFSADPLFRREGTDKYFWKILTACPYTAEWLNKKQGDNKRSLAFVPFNEDYIPPKTEKIYDVIYVGGIHSSDIHNIIKSIKKFNYRFVSMSEWLTYKIWRNTKIFQKIYQKISPYLPKTKSKYITDKNVTYVEKLKIISQSKISVVYTILNAHARAVENIRKTDGWRDNKAFGLIPDKSILNTIGNYLFQREYNVPQQKGRLFESAFCRSLILCQKDHFRVIENFFEEGKEFVYFEPGHLEEKIKEILANWERYESIIENAFQKAKCAYTTKHFVEKYLAPIS